MKTTSLPPTPMPGLASGDNAEPGTLELSTPAPLPGVALLHEEAARHAEIAAQFIRNGDRLNARGHLMAAMGALNEAAIED